MSDRNDWAICLHLVGSPEKAMAPHSSNLAWKIPWMQEPGRLQSMGLRRVGHDWAISLSLFTFHFPALEKEMATHSNVLAWRIPGTGEPGGLPSMASHRVWHWSGLAATAAVGSLLLNHMLAAGFWEGRTTPKLRTGASSVLLHSIVYSGHKANPHATIE